MDDVGEPVVLRGRAGQVVDRVQDRRQEEPRQEQRADEVLDVAEDDRRARDGERDRRRADEDRGERDRDPLGRRTRGRNGEVEREHDANMTTNATRFVATDESGTSWRGKRVLRISAAASSRLFEAAWSELAKKTQSTSPVSRKSPG